MNNFYGNIKISVNKNNNSKILLITFNEPSSEIMYKLFGKMNYMTSGYSKYFSNTRNILDEEMTNNLNVNQHCFVKLEDVKIQIEKYINYVIYFFKTRDLQFIMETQVNDKRFILETCHIDSFLRYFNKIIEKIEK
jgi:hypothetical protein